MSERSKQFEERKAHIYGYDQVCCPSLTHGQDLPPPNETPVSLRMVDTALNDHGNLTPDLCDVQIQEEKAREGLSQKVQSDSLKMLLS